MTKKPRILNRIIYLISMENRRVISLIMVLMMFYEGCSDFSHDREECQDQLVNLSPCQGFVSGVAKSPPPSCCIELQKDSEKSRLCLCILINDRDEHGLGFKLNATLALSLPFICHVPSVAPECPELLKLAPGSPDAQVFELFNNTSGFGNSTSAGDIVPNTSSKLGVNGIQLAAVVGILVWALISA